MGQMHPAHCRERVEAFRLEIGHKSHRQHIILSLSLQVLPREFSSLWVFFRVKQLKVAVKHEESRSHHNEQQGEQEVLYEKGHELRRADALFLDEQVVLSVALVAVDALVLDNVRCLAVGVNLLAGALTR